MTEISPHIHNLNNRSRSFLPILLSIGMSIMLVILLWRWLYTPLDSGSKLSTLKRCSHWIEIAGAVRYPKISCLHKSSHARKYLDLRTSLINVQPLCLLPRDIPLPDRGQQLFIAAPNQGHECILRLTTMEASRRILLGIPLNLNTDDAQSLAAIPGLSLRIALRIVEHRQHKGAFRHWEDLLAVRGIGPKTLHKIRPYLVLEEQHNQTDSNQGGLNTAFELSSNSTSFVKFKCSGKKPKNEVKSGQLSIHLNGFASDRGHALLALHTSERHFPHNYKAAYNYQKLSITKRTAQVTIKDLPYGVYAIVAFHDANDNGKLDTNLFGVPTEAYGTSNNARRRFGPPRFRDARFKFRTAHHKISIHLR